MRMKSSSENMELSKSKYISIVVGAMVGISLLILPATLAKGTHQDGWISAIIGVIYPMTFVILSSYIISKHPDENILAISKKHFGKIIGSMFNLVWLTFCGFIGINVLAGYNNLMRSYVVGWLSPFKFIIICALVAAYAAYSGLQTVGKICEVAMIVTIILSVSPIQALKVSSLLNVKPILGSGIHAILSNAPGSVMSYSGIEVILIFHPYVKEKKKIKWYSLISTIFVCILYTWVCFVSIYYLGPDIVTKSAWPLILATQSVTVTIINNYSYFFILMWGIIGIRCIAIYYYSSMVIVKDFLPKTKKLYICVGVYIIFVYLAMKLGNELNRRAIVDKIIQVYVVINLVGLIIICIQLYFKRNENK